MLSSCWLAKIFICLKQHLSFFSFLSMFPTRSVMYSSNELAKRILLGSDNVSGVREEEKQVTASIVALSGAFSGVWGGGRDS